MRTTITISDSVYREAKATAAREGLTVGDLIEDAVRSFLHRSRVPVEQVKPFPTFAGGGGLQPGVDITDNSALLDLMDDGVPLDALR